MSKPVVIRVTLHDESEARRFLDDCLKRGLDARREDERPVGALKRNGPALAQWLDQHPGWHVILQSANRHSAWNAAWKISRGTRRGFETLAYEARPVNRDGRWQVEARRKPSPRRKPIPENMEPLF